MEDYHSIIVWDSNKDFIQKVESVFSNSIILKKEIKLSQQDRGTKINELYAPVHVPLNSTRCTSQEPITIFIIQIPAKYKYVFRTEGYRLCNMDILNFKLENRLKFDYNIFHCSDNVDETKRTLQVFDLVNEMPTRLLFDDYSHEPTCSIVPVEHLYHIRHLNNGSLQFIPIKDGVAVLSLIGYENHTLVNKYELLHRSDEEAIIQERSLQYFSIFSNFDQSHPECHISAYRYDDEHYIVTDGKHRSALLYFRGDRHIFVQHTPRPCDDLMINNSIQSPNPNSHIENFNKFCYELHNNNIRFVVIRGFDTMPKTANTDLDIVIYPEDYDKFLQIANQNITSGSLAFNVEKQYKHSTYPLWYRAYRTQGTHNQFLTNNGYQLDTYNNIFFFASHDVGTVLSQEFLNYLFDNRIKKHNLYIPNGLAEMVLLFCRTWIDLGGNWKPKHKNSFDALSLEYSQEQLKEILAKSLEPEFQYLLQKV